MNWEDTRNSVLYEKHALKIRFLMPGFKHLSSDRHTLEFLHCFFIKNTNKNKIV
jgi:S-ribosylhomocysteine lyase LuxS involved in autoinducer biosynthesis